VNGGIASIRDVEGDVVTASFAVVLPDEPVPVRLMNTIWADRNGVHDALTTPGDLRAWLAAAYPDDKVRGADLARFRGLREALHPRLKASDRYAVEHNAKRVATFRTTFRPFQASNIC